MNNTLLELSYLVAAVLFIVGLKGLTKPRTAVRGNTLSALGMLIAVVATLACNKVFTWELILAGLAVGTVIGIILAVRIEMTSMPELVALFNGLGGGASALIGCAALVGAVGGGLPAEVNMRIAFLSATVASALMGVFTFWGSLVAFGKLQGLIPEGLSRFPGAHIINGLFSLAAVGTGVAVVFMPEQLDVFWISVAAASVVGVLVTVKVGAADMPVVIALLNSLSGLAASATGFVLANNLLIIAGALVGASGLILTGIMCRAMNRSLANVMFGGVGTGETQTQDADEVYKGKVKSTSSEEVAMLLDVARRVVVVPGYGMAVAQAQHAVRDLMNLLVERGVEVEFGIHPVAGRMPGHMNVLLAEANVPYDRLKEMDEINATFETTDVVLVIGANDVVNPLARTDPKSPIAGMPILNVDYARTIVIIKRSLSPGFAKIPNPLFALDNSLMLFGDGREIVLELISALKEG